MPGYVALALATFWAAEMSKMLKSSGMNRNARDNRDGEIFARDLARGWRYPGLTTGCERQSLDTAQTRPAFFICAPGCRE